MSDSDSSTDSPPHSPVVSPFAKKPSPKPSPDDIDNQNTVEILSERSYIQSDLSFKVIVIGNSGVGKTCLALRAIKDSFDAETTPTIGFELLNMYIKINDKIITLQIWDTCGQETYQSVVSKFYRRAALAILVYSISDIKSFENLDTWLSELRNNASDNIKIALVGNKVDLERVVTKEAALNYKTKNKLHLIFESSAKHGDNTKDIFKEAAKLLYKDYLQYEKTVNISSSSSTRNTNLSSKGYNRPSNPYSANKKLPKKDIVVHLEDPGDGYMDDDQHGSCTKC
jgi:small GTP-binding protein